jgi:nucleoside-diphosphate-sugar epimerase
MHVLVIGATGMLGRKLTQRITSDAAIGGSEIKRLTLADVIEPSAPEGFAGEVETIALDIAKPQSAQRMLADRPEIIFHLAAIVSGEAELNFDKGYAINLDGTRHLLEEIRSVGSTERYIPRVIFASSIAVFGAPFPEKIGDEFFQTPRTSYGTQKVIGELLLSDYSRRGFIDGIALRLPTVCIRPGKPNKAASGFFSNILREPLIGLEAVLPVSEDVRHWHVSPRRAVGFLLHAAAIDLTSLENRRALNMPGLSATVGDQIEALKRVAGEGVVRLIRRETDPAIVEIVSGWPKDFNPQRALELGFVGDASFDEIIRIHIEDELGGSLSVSQG